MAGKNLERQRKQYECKLEYMKTIKNEKEKTDAIIKQKEKVVGQKKKGMEAVKMKYPAKGELICTPDELKKASVLSFQHTNKQITKRRMEE